MMPAGLRISFITGQLGLGGAEKQLFLLARGLLQAGWQVSVVNMSHRQGEYWDHALRQAGIPVYGIRMNLPRLNRLIEIRNILKKSSVNIVHSWTMHTNLYASVSGRLAGTPIRMGSERCNHHSSQRAVGKLYNLCLWGLDALVVNSNQEAEFLRRHRENLNVCFVPNGVEVPGRPVDSEQRRECREQLGIVGSSPVIGAVGSMVPRKNFSTLIKALAVLARKNVAFTLVLIGDGPMVGDLKQQAASCLPENSYFFPGSIPNAVKFYPAFDIHCMPSIDQEGMPNVVMEASAAGLPVVASNVAGVPELIENGITGLLVPPNDVEILAEQLQKLLQDSDIRQRMGQAGIEKMDRGFSVAKMVTRMTKIYEQLLLRV